MTRVSRKSLFLIAAFALASAASLSAQQPEVKVNILHVCSPTPEEQKEISSALSRVPKQPRFDQDFEVARGRSSLSADAGFLQAGQSAQLSGEPSVANWVRLRRDFIAQAAFSTVQYSFSDDGKNMIETLALHVRDPKDLVLLSIEDSASSVTSAATMLAAATPASRIELQRFGKTSVVLARCSGSAASPAPDQSTYEPLLSDASAIMTNYRTLLNARHTVPGELSRLTDTSSKSTTKSSRGRTHTASSVSENPKSEAK